MNDLLTKKILRSINEDIKLIYFISLKTGYCFYILSTTNFIYKIIINKNYSRCNCEDYFKSKFCKHICFILFKVLKIYKISLSNFQIKLINDDLQNTSYFLDKKFPPLDWSIFKKKFFKIKTFLNSDIFNQDYYNKFNDFYHQFYYNIYKKIERSDKNCVFCMSQLNKGVKCPVCKNVFHTHCLVKLLNKNKKCPECNNDYWNLYHKYMILLENRKIKFSNIVE
jgi:hypothetical protein